jgi:hypothetical protein
VTKHVTKQGLCLNIICAQVVMFSLEIGLCKTAFAASGISLCQRLLPALRYLYTSPVSFEALAIPSRGRLL